MRFAEVLKKILHEIDVKEVKLRTRETRWTFSEILVGPGGHKRRKKTSTRKVGKMADTGVVLSELLAYVNTYQGRSTDFNIRLAILRWFNIDEISTARTAMENGVKTVIPTYPHFGKRRTDSANRSAREVMVSDILEMFKYLDAVEDKDSIPSFAAVNVAKLPPASPEAAADMMSVMETLAAQQRQLAQLQETVVSLRHDVEVNKAGIRNKDISMPDSVTDGRILGNMPSETSTSSGATVVKNTTADAGEGTSSTSDPKPTGSQSNGSYAEAVNREGNETSFQTGGKRPNKGINKGAGAKKSSAPKICGTKQCDNLKAGPNTVQVQITNVNSSTSSGDIEKYISDTEENISALKVEDKSENGWDTKRYVVTFDYKHLQTVISSEFWPKGIYIKRWFPVKRLQQSPGVF